MGASFHLSYTVLKRNSGIFEASEVTTLWRYTNLFIIIIIIIIITKGTSLWWNFVP